MAVKTHLSKIRPNAFGGITTGTLCNRLRVLADGMNVTTDPAEVTCAFCLRMMAVAEKKRAA